MSESPTSWRRKKGCNDFSDAEIAAIRMVHSFEFKFMVNGAEVRRRKRPDNPLPGLQGAGGRMIRSPSSRNEEEGLCATKWGRRIPHCNLLGWFPR
jgi:hypothetical protein